jgi:phosphopantothenoylcysteine decarboxylase/phosphopantothenate--cysteine ligase
VSRPLRLLVTAGPTREFLDPVRFISNASSGRQGVAIAEEGLRRGWIVELVHGPLEVPAPAGARLHRVTSASEMLERCRMLHPACNAVVGAAAVSDFRPREPLAAKRRRQGSAWSLELVPTVDILAELGKVKGARVHVGFALETENPRENAARKLREKNLDWVIANRPEAIGAGGGEYLLLGATGEETLLGRLSKTELAARICALLEAAPVT